MGVAQDESPSRASLVPRPAELGVETPTRKLHRLIGAVIEGYVLRSLIGKGSGTVVFAAENDAGQKVAIKVRREGFDDEPLAIGDVKHPSLVRKISTGTLPTGESYLIMERVAGRTLKRRLETSGPLAPQQAVTVLRPIAQALHALHREGVQHKWVRPDQVIVTNLNGAAPRFVDLEIGRRSPSRSGARATATSLRYQAYGLAALAFELMAGRPPFDESVIEAEKFSTRAPYLSTVSRRLFSVQIERAMAACFSLEPDERPDTPIAVVHLLEAALREEPGGS
jgi:serine/threonine protein kinase